MTPKFIVGNWKMNGRQSALRILVEMRDGFNTMSRDVLIGICPPFTIISEGSKLFADCAQVRLGGQTCSEHSDGPHTGEISSEMLADAGAGFVILGHSERRAMGESCEMVSLKSIAALRAGLLPLICVGEQLADREAGRADTVIREQVRKSIPRLASGQSVYVAYEPIWAIGTGKTATVTDILPVHAAIADEFSQCQDRATLTGVLYGGSVSPANSAELLSNGEISGVLVGGASLKADSFLHIAGIK